MKTPDYAAILRDILEEEARAVGIHRLTGLLNQRLTRQWRVTGKKVGQYLRRAKGVHRLPKRRVDWIIRSDSFYELIEND